MFAYTTDLASPLAHARPLAVHTMVPTTSFYSQADFDADWAYNLGAHGG